MRHFLPIAMLVVSGCAPATGHAVGVGWCEDPDPATGEFRDVGCDPGPRPAGEGWVEFDANGTPTHWLYFTPPCPGCAGSLSIATTLGDLCETGYTCGWIQGPSAEDLASIEATCASTPGECFVPIGD